MIVTLKPHSAYKSFFNAASYDVDIAKYSDILSYLSAMHPKFATYCKKQALQVQQEDFTIVDKNLKVVKNEELSIRAAKEGDVLYLVPAVTGGGGKRNVLTMVLLAAFFIAMPYALPALGEATLLSAAVTGGAPLTLASLSTTIGMNLALGALASLFSPKPQTQEQARQNGLFSGLQNTTESGVPIALHYGQVRIAGQLLSGYINTVTHGKSETITVEGDLYDYTAD